MAYPGTSPSGTRLISSRQLIPGSLVNDMNDALYSYQLLLATGVGQSDAAKVNAANVEIAAASAANTGVALVKAVPGAVISVLNNSTQTENVYPNGTDQIQNGAATYANADEVARYRNDFIEVAVIEETMSYEEAMERVGKKELSAEAKKYPDRSGYKSI